MPKVPQYQDKQRLAPQNPTGFQSADRAGMVGDAISGLGQTISYLGEVKASIAKSEKSLATNYAKSIAEEQYQKFLYQQATDDSNGDKDVSKFEDDSTSIEDFVLNSTQEKFGDMHTDAVKIVIQEIKNGTRDKVMSAAIKKSGKFLTQNLVEQNARNASVLANNPDSLDDIMFSAIDMNTQILKAHGKGDSFIQADNKRLSKSLVRAAIDGHVNQGTDDGSNFDSARKLLKAQGINYTTDELRDINDYIDKKESQFSNTQSSMEALREKKRKDQEDKKINAIKNVYRGKLIEAEEAGNVAEVAKLRTELLNINNQKFPTSEKFGGFIDSVRLSKSRTLQERDNDSSFSVTKEFVRANSAKELQNLQYKVEKYEASGKISNKKAQEWSLRIENAMKNVFSDPMKKAQYDRFKEKLKVYTKSEEFLNLNKGSPAELQRYFGTHSEYTGLVLAGVDPEVAYYRVLETNFPSGIREYTIRGYDSAIKFNDPSTIQAAEEHAERLRLSGNPYYLQFKSELDHVKKLYDMTNEDFNQIKKNEERIRAIDNKIKMLESDDYFDKKFNVDKATGLEFDRAFQVVPENE